MTRRYGHPPSQLKNPETPSPHTLFHTYWDRQRIAIQIYVPTKHYVQPRLLSFVLTGLRSSTTTLRYHLPDPRTPFKSNTDCTTFHSACIPARFLLSLTNTTLPPQLPDFGGFHNVIVALIRIGEQLGVEYHLSTPVSRITLDSSLRRGSY